ncbi:MAG: hypothetical protein ACT6Q3_02235 [Sphingopyxis sp.]|jgi:hypothetical protein|nr:MAG: hypothetical protein A2885_17395 [Sphingopyxis sp. RIFCSPHIGHO2_01_FULL_65_24]
MTELISVNVYLSNYVHGSGNYKIFVEGPGGNQEAPGVTSANFNLQKDGHYWAYGQYVGGNSTHARHGHSFFAGNSAISVDMNRD